MPRSHLTCRLAVLIMIAGCARAGAAEPLPGPVHLFLPPVINATPGIECNIYFDNVTLAINPANYAFDVTCTRGLQHSERWTYTPGAEEAGEYALSLEVRDGSNAVVARAETIILVVPAGGADETMSALLIGDSLTHASVYPRHLTELFTMPETPSLALVGSHQPESAGADIRHEGYGGWTAERFATFYTGAAREGAFKDRGSPFLYENEAGEPELDYSRYCEDVNGGVRPDVVTVFLGCNDVFSATDETIDSRIDSMLTHLESLIGAILAVRPDTRIGLIPPVPPTASQDAFGINYANGQTRWQYKRNQHKTVLAMYERFGHRASEGITLIPAFANLDCKHNYPVRTVAWNARTGETGVRQSNSVHPSEAGYRQIGDSIYGWMLAR